MCVAGGLWGSERGRGAGDGRAGARRRAGLPRARCALGRRTAAFVPLRACRGMVAAHCSQAVACAPPPPPPPHAVACALFLAGLCLTKEHASVCSIVRIIPSCPSRRPSTLRLAPPPPPPPRPVPDRGVCVGPLHPAHPRGQPLCGVPRGGAGGAHALPRHRHPGEQQPGGRAVWAAAAVVRCPSGAFPKWCVPQVAGRERRRASREPQQEAIGQAMRAPQACTWSHACLACLPACLRLPQVLYGLPRLLTGSILAHELMHAYLRMAGCTGAWLDVLHTLWCLCVGRSTVEEDMRGSRAMCPCVLLPLLALLCPAPSHFANTLTNLLPCTTCEQARALWTLWSRRACASSWPSSGWRHSRRRCGGGDSARSRPRQLCAGLGLQLLCQLTTLHQLFPLAGGPPQRPANVPPSGVQRRFPALHNSCGQLLAQRLLDVRFVVCTGCSTVLSCGCCTYCTVRGALPAGVQGCV